MELNACLPMAPTNWEVRMGEEEHQRWRDSVLCQLWKRERKREEKEERVELRYTEKKRGEERRALMGWWEGTEGKENRKNNLFCSTNLNHYCWPQVTSPQYKTVLCQQFMEGKGCQFGESCSFAHGHAEIRNVQMNLAALNPNYKGTLCKYFMTTGECEFGSICQYAHGNMVGRRLKFPHLILTFPRRS